MFVFCQRDGTNRRHHQISAHKTHTALNHQAATCNHSISNFIAFWLVIISAVDFYCSFYEPLFIFQSNQLWRTSQPEFYALINNIVAERREIEYKKKHLSIFIKIKWS